MAMLFNETYELTLLNFGDEMRTGTTFKQARQAAKLMGRVLQSKRKFDLEADTGILRLSGMKNRAGDHVVVLREGLVIDTDATIWDVDVYLAAHGATVESLWVVKGDQ